MGQPGLTPGSAGLAAPPRPTGPPGGHYPHGASARIGAGERTHDRRVAQTRGAAAGGPAHGAVARPGGGRAGPRTGAHRAARLPRQPTPIGGGNVVFLPPGPVVAFGAGAPGARTRLRRTSRGAHRQPPRPGPGPDGARRFPASPGARTGPGVWRSKNGTARPREAGARRRERLPRPPQRLDPRPLLAAGRCPDHRAGSTTRKVEKSNLPH